MTRKNKVKSKRHGAQSVEEEEYFWVEYGLIAQNIYYQSKPMISLIIPRTTCTELPQ